jgi:hypothetical protein
MPSSRPWNRQTRNSKRSLSLDRACDQRLRQLRLESLEFRLLLAGAPVWVSQGPGPISSPQSILGISGTVPIERNDETVAAHYGVRPADLESCQACGGAAKFVAVELACRLTGMTQHAVGAHYGAISSAAVTFVDD